jgi:uncharacterized protein YqhQ
VASFSPGLVAFQFGACHVKPKQTFDPGPAAVGAKREDSWRPGLIYLLGASALLDCRPTVGGQAVIEGVMMRAPRSLTVAVRRPQGQVTVKRQDIRSLGERFPLLKLPLVRGGVALIEALVYGISALNYSANEALAEEESGGELGPWALGGIVALALGMGLLLFFFLPLTLTHWMGRHVSAMRGSTLLFNLTDGVLRVGIFVLYVIFISRLREVRRVFEYHGAEHAAIHAYEEGRELVVEKAKGLSPLHPRCGTAFLLWVMVISILLFSLIRANASLPVKMISRIFLLPLVAGASYELIRISGSGRNRLVDWLTRPGLWLQRITTRTPHEDQLEVAIRALQEVLEMERQKASLLKVGEEA